MFNICKHKNIVRSINNKFKTIVISLTVQFQFVIMKIQCNISLYQSDKKKKNNFLVSIIIKRDMASSLQLIRKAHKQKPYSGSSREKHHTHTK